MVSENTLGYWKSKCEEIERELEDFRESSQMLEKELESALEQDQKTIKDLRIKNNRLQLENDTLKERYGDLQRGLEGRVSELEEERARWHKREEDYVKYIRELEQKNDDLERSQRATSVSLSEFKGQLNSALERNVLLESELDEKEALQILVQRLKDEARDLKQEVHVREKTKDTPGKHSLVVDSNKIVTPDRTNPEPLHSPISMSMTPPSRISAMNIVGDLLRKVGALESKLASCRGSPRDSISPSDPPFRGKRLHRGTSTPSIHNLVKS